MKVKLPFLAQIAEIKESTTPCHDARIVGFYLRSNLGRLTVIAVMSEDYTFTFSFH